MITISTAKRYCKEDISLIENYEEAIASSEKWECHHRKEIELNVGTKELIEMGLYYNRPAEELIFLSSKEHRVLHGKGRTVSQETREKIASKLRGRPSGMLGKYHPEERKKRIAESNTGKKRPSETCKRISESKKGTTYKTTRTGKKMYTSPTGVKKYFIPGQEPEGWV